MNRKTWIGLAISLLSMSMAGCGFGGFSGGGGGGSSPGASQPPAEPNTVSGVASKGPIVSGTLKIYAINPDGTILTQGQKKLLTETKITNGSYKADIGAYSGTVLLEAYGTYIDEATGQLISIASESPLRAAVAGVSSSITVAVTPLTELAVRKVIDETKRSDVLPPDKITSANQLISELFKVDIIATEPLEPSSDVFNQRKDALSFQSQKDYTLALAAISQMAKDKNVSVDAALQTMTGHIQAGNYIELATEFKTALTGFLGSPRNTTGITDINLTNLVNVGGRTQGIALKIADYPNPADYTIQGVTATLELPAGVTVKANFFTENAYPVILAEAVVILKGALPYGKRYTPASGTTPGTATLGIPISTTIPAVEFATLYCDLPPGTTLKQGTTLNESDVFNFRLVDQNQQVVGTGRLLPDYEITGTGPDEMGGIIPGRVEIAIQ